MLRRGSSGEFCRLAHRGGGKRGRNDEADALVGDRIKGEATIKKYVFTAGAKIKHGFCGDCGSSVCVWREPLNDVAFNVSRILYKTCDRSLEVSCSMLD